MRNSPEDLNFEKRNRCTELVGQSPDMEQYWLSQKCGKPQFAAVIGTELAKSLQSPCKKEAKYVLFA